MISTVLEGVSLIIHKLLLIFFDKVLTAKHPYYIQRKIKAGGVIHGQHSKWGNGASLFLKAMARDSILAGIVTEDIN